MSIKLGGAMMSRPFLLNLTHVTTTLHYDKLVAAPSLFHSSLSIFSPRCVGDGLSRTSNIM